PAPPPPPRPAAAAPVQSGSYPQVSPSGSHPQAASPAAKPVTKPRSMDVLGELEKLRREAMQQPAGAPAAAPAAAKAASTNGRGELSRTIELTLKKADFQRARRFTVSFQVEDDQNRVMDAVRDLQVDLKDVGGLEKLLLRLNIALNAKE
ncbi:MAG TPA: hypothetical protein VJ725_00050, partial [Thermoanaerobaculia bacterium]|nr:hypothetical protein [Thermoanaerobaculia bacterium]